MKRVTFNKDGFLYDGYGNKEIIHRGETVNCVTVFYYRLATYYVVVIKDHPVCVHKEHFMECLSPTINESKDTQM